MQKQKKLAKCPMGVVSPGGRLKLRIVYHLLDGTLRFGELQRLIPEASRQMLTLQLRTLEREGWLHREVFEQMPPRVEYSLTKEGWNKEPILRQMFTWSEQMGISF